MAVRHDKETPRRRPRHQRKPVEVGQGAKRARYKVVLDLADKRLVLPASRVARFLAGKGWQPVEVLATVSAGCPKGSEVPTRAAVTRYMHDERVRPANLDPVGENALSALFVRGMRKPGFDRRTARA
jgi:hypothetical protein